VALELHWNVTTRTKTNYFDAMTNFILDGKCQLTNMFLPFLVVCLVPKAKSPQRTSLMAAWSSLTMHPPTFIWLIKFLFVLGRRYVLTKHSFAWEICDHSWRSRWRILSW
jgi:hypothetical protein